MNEFIFQQDSVNNAHVFSFGDPQRGSAIVCVTREGVSFEIVIDFVFYILLFGYETFIMTRIFLRPNGLILNTVKGNEVIILL